MNRTGSTRRERDLPVVIVGGGVIGVCCAYSLSADGIPVVLLERDEICSGCSFGNLGLLATSHSIPLASPSAISNAARWMFDPQSPFAVQWRMDKNLYKWLWQFIKASSTGRIEAATAELVKLVQASVKLFKEHGTSGEFAFGLEQRGLLEVFSTTKAFAEARRSADMLRRAGLRTDVLEAEDVKAVEPAAAATVVGALLYHDDCHISPAAFVSGLAALAKRMGAVINEKCEVVNFTVSNDSITAVETRSATYKASTVVVAAGASSADLARALSLEMLVQPGRGYTFTVPREGVWPIRPLMFAEAKVLVTPIGNELRIGGTLELATTDSPVNLRRARSVTKRLSEYLDRSISIDGTEVWSGYRPCSPDGFPIIGWSKKYSNLFYATGHGMLGVTLGPITGQITSQLVRGLTPTIGLDRVSPTRFGAVC